MKHGEGKGIAHDLYVYEQMTFEEVANRTGRTEKTIRTWADDGDWKGERERDLASRVSVHEKLHVLIQKLTDRMIRDCDQEKELSSHSLHALRNLVNSIKGLYKYEGDQQAVDTTKGDKPSPEDLSNRIREILGS